MDKIFKKLAQISHDKLLHSFYGTLIYVGVSLVDWVIALATVVVVAIAKEVWDEMRYGGFSVTDIVFTVAIPVLLFIKEFYAG